MQAIFDTGINLALQQYSPQLDPFFRAVTSLGGLRLVLLGTALVFWCIDRRQGVRLACVLLVATFINALAKEVANMPRPYACDPRVLKIGHAGGGGFPSSHTQITVVFWSFIAYTFRRWWVWCLAAAAIILVPLSRLYLGVHFPIDLAGGALIAVAVLIAFLLCERPVARWFARQGTACRLALALIAPFGLLLAFPGHGRFACMLTAAMCGLGAGFILERRHVGFSSDGPWWQRLLRLPAGLAGLYLLQAGLAALPLARPALPVALFGLGGLWISLGAPWLFVRAGIARQQLPPPAG